MAKFAGTRGGPQIVGVQDSSGNSNIADVNSAGELTVSVDNQSAGTLNATGQVSIANTATQIIGASTRQGLLITNPSSSVTVYLGGSNAVTTSNGQALTPGNSISLPVNSSVWGIVSTGTQTVTYAEVV